MRRSDSSCVSPGPRVPTPPPEPLEVLPHPPHALQRVLELGQLDLELALGGVRVLGEDVEDDGGAVDHPHLQRVLERALLARRELVVGDDHLGVELAGQLPQLVELARARGRCADRAGGGAARGLDRLAPARCAAARASPSSSSAPSEPGGRDAITTPRSGSWSRVVIMGHEEQYTGRRDRARRPGAVRRRRAVLLDARHRLAQLVVGTVSDRRT